MRKKTKREPDTFVSGLIVGLFAGGISQFLSSPQGREFKTNLFDQWRQARGELIKKGLIDESVPEEADEMLKYLWQETALGLSELKSKLAQTAGSKRKGVAKSKTKKRKRLKFKGV